MTKTTGANPYTSSTPAPKGESKLPWILGAAVVGIVVIIGLAVLLWPSEENGAGAGAGTGAEAAKNATQENAAVTISGEDLPALPDTGQLLPAAGEDPAVGLAAPKLVGQSFDESEVVIDPSDGKPKMVVFLAHWCPHCQAEVPLLQEWIASGDVPEGLEIYAVSTGVDSSRPNYPPSNWIASEGWDAADPSRRRGPERGQVVGPHRVPLHRDAGRRGQRLAAGLGRGPRRGHRNASPTSWWRARRPPACTGRQRRAELRLRRRRHHVADQRAGDHGRRAAEPPALASPPNLPTRLLLPVPSRAQLRPGAGRLRGHPRVLRHQRHLAADPVAPAGHAAPAPRRRAGRRTVPPGSEPSVGHGVEHLAHQLGVVTGLRSAQIPQSTPITERLRRRIWLVGIWGCRRRRSRSPSGGRSRRGPVAPLRCWSPPTGSITRSAFRRR